jgi:DUF2934 family protein
VRDTNTTKHEGINHWLLLDLTERKIRLRSERLYEKRGQADVRGCEDWLKALSEVLATLNAG